MLLAATMFFFALLAFVFRKAACADFSSFLVLLPSSVPGPASGKSSSPSDAAPLPFLVLALGGFTLLA